MAKSLVENAQLFKGAAPEPSKPEQARSISKQEQITQAESRQISESDLASQIREIQAVLLWLLEPIIQALETLTFVYPDLRAELTPVLREAQERAQNALENWFPPPTPLEEESSETTAPMEDEQSEEE